MWWWWIWPMAMVWVLARWYYQHGYDRDAPEEGYVSRLAVVAWQHWKALREHELTAELDACHAEIARLRRLVPAGQAQPTYPHIVEKRRAVKR